jgi:hypothetical protein
MQPKPPRDKRIVIDTGPLVTLLCGFGDSDVFDIERARPVLQAEKEAWFYSRNASAILAILTKNLIAITPQVAAEVSNMVKRQDLSLSRIMNSRNPMARMIMNKACVELHATVQQILSSPMLASHVDLGITDCALLMIMHSSWPAPRPDIIMTDDDDLVNWAGQLGLKAVHPPQLPFSG